MAEEDVRVSIMARLNELRPGDLFRARSSPKERIMKRLQDPALIKSGAFIREITSLFWFEEREERGVLRCLEVRMEPGAVAERFFLEPVDVLEFELISHDVPQAAMAYIGTLLGKMGSMARELKFLTDRMTEAKEALDAATL